MKQHRTAQDVVFDISLKIGGWLDDAGVESPVVRLERTATPEFGEFATNIALQYAKALQQSPLQSAEAVAEMLNRSDLKGLERAEAAAPGFVNIYLTNEVKVTHVAAILEQGDSYGTNTHYVEEKWVVEHTSPNPNKAMHLGHLRNNLIGMSIVRLLQGSGATVVSDNIYNDRGIAIAKVMYGFLSAMKKSSDTPTEIGYWVSHKDEWYTPVEKELKPDVFITQCYVQGEAAMAEATIEQTVRQLVVDWEAGNKHVWALWEHVLAYAYEGIDRTLSRLGNHWDKVWYEHKHYQKGKQYVQKGLDKGLFTVTDDGAVLTDLEADYELPDTVLLKRDGTSLYITQDLALTDLKKSSYSADKLVWVVGPEQSLSFKQLFAVCEQLGIGRREDFMHVSYGYVGLKDGDGAFQKMSSRAGTVVLIDDVIDTVKAAIATRLGSEGKSAEELEQVAETLAIGAVKFAFLRSDRTQDVSFAIEQSVDVQGDSGMYVLYTYARIQSLLRKSTVATETTHAQEKVGEEAAVLRALLYYPDVIEKATNDLSAHHVAQYLLELSSACNSWYAKETFLDGTPAEAYRMQVLSAAAQTIKNGLGILGIATVSEF